MKNFRLIWLFGLAITLALIIVPIVIFTADREKQADDDPWANVPLRIPHTDHTDIIEGPFESGSDVTRACLECH
ncbi:MAG: hypothetical protein H8D34_24450, partial [Chloroflexi bacterium]|nr:hypothetical protein [Chloroflexota bacterium]